MKMTRHREQRTRLVRSHRPGHGVRVRGGLAALMVALAVLVTGAGVTPASAASAKAGSPATATVSANWVKFLTAKQKKARNRQLRKCKKKRKAKQRRNCRQKVNKRFRKIALQRKQRLSGKTFPVAVKDNVFEPSAITVKKFDWINWDWSESVIPEGHDVQLIPGWTGLPDGIEPSDFRSPVLYGPTGRFKRQFEVPGSYTFYCSLHPETMMMTVQVNQK